MYLCALTQRLSAGARLEPGVGRQPPPRGDPPDVGAHLQGRLPNDQPEDPAEPAQDVSTHSTNSSLRPSSVNPLSQGPLAHVRPQHAPDPGAGPEPDAVSDERRQHRAVGHGEGGRRGPVGGGLADADARDVSRARISILAELLIGKLEGPLCLPMLAGFSFVARLRVERKGTSLSQQGHVRENESV